MATPAPRRYIYTSVAAAVVGVGIVGGVALTCWLRKSQRNQQQHQPSIDTLAQLAATAIPCPSAANTTCNTGMGSSCSSSSSAGAAATTGAEGGFDAIPSSVSSPLALPATSLTVHTQGAGVNASASGALSALSPATVARRAVVVNLAPPRVNPDEGHPLILIVCGPSGVGKGTLLQMLQRVLPHSFAKSISHTTRQPRAGEEDGKHYHFADKGDMEAAIANNEFLEHAKVHTNYYGTSLQSVKTVQASKRIPILEVDIQGAHTIHHHPEFKDPKLKPLVLFILPPTFDSLHERLRGRGSETPTSLTTRLETAKVELKRLADCEFCDIAITNDNLDTAFIELLTSLSRVYPHLVSLLPAAQYETSLLYKNGFIPAVKPDPVRALQWLQRAALSGARVDANELAEAQKAADAVAPPSAATVVNAKL